MEATFSSENSVFAEKTTGYYNNAKSIYSPLWRPEWQTGGHNLHIRPCFCCVDTAWKLLAGMNLMPFGQRCLLRQLPVKRLAQQPACDWIWEDSAALMEVTSSRSETSTEFEVLTAIVAVTPCSSERDRRFGRKRLQAELSSWFLVRLTLRPRRWGRYIAPKRGTLFELKPKKFLVFSCLYL